jgi:hypothetical protein
MSLWGDLFGGRKAPARGRVASPTAAAAARPDREAALALAQQRLQELRAMPPGDPGAFPALNECSRLGARRRMRRPRPLHAACVLGQRAPAAASSRAPTRPPLSPRSPAA